MNDAIIVRFDIQDPGEHILLNAKSLPLDGGNYQALLRIAGAHAVAGLVLKTHRSKVQKSTKELSISTEVSEAAINRMENGSKPITLDLATALETALPGLIEDLRSIGHLK